MAATRLIVTADDFGRSTSINEAVGRAHQEGILTCASLMVTGEAVEGAIELARRLPGLGVGLHLTLVQGRSALSPADVPGLVDARGAFAEDPVRAGWAYWVRRDLLEQIRNEVAAQFELFRRTGLTLDHVNGHLHLHLHPRILPLVLKEAAQQGVRGVRLTRDRFWLNARLAGGRWCYRLTHAVLFSWLAGWARRRLSQGGFRFPEAVFGLLQDGRVDASYLVALLGRLPSGSYEVYSHPALHPDSREWEGLVHSEVLRRVRDRGIRLIRYQDL